MGKAPSHKKSKVIIPKWGLEQDAFRRSTKYPGCRGTFPECPDVIDLNKVHDECAKCPMYKGR